MNYYKAMPPYDEYKAAALHTTTQQLRDAIHTVERLGVDEVIFFTWSTEIDQIARVADLIG